jgi:guanylate kinase
LRNRLVLRRTDSPDDIERRLRVARQEMEQVESFEYVVINHEDRLDEAVGQIRAIIVAEKQRVMARRVVL